MNAALCIRNYSNYTLAWSNSLNVQKDFDYWEEVNPGVSCWDAKGSVDPDSRSRNLQLAHQLLWSKLLPSGQIFDLKPAQGTQLIWGKYRLSSDSISNSYMTNIRMRDITLSAGMDAEELFKAGSRIGGFILFPSYRVDKKTTINAARGMSTKIGDRMDLTLEGIRRHYRNEESPLSDVLNRYSDFFELFINFEEYTAFWLLDDLIGSDNRIKYFLPFDGYKRDAKPIDLQEYLKLKDATLKFLIARSERMHRWIENRC